jgi:hypothetical protein
MLVGAALVVGTVIATTAGISYASHKDRTVYRADVMAGVTAPYTGNTNAIRGVPGGGLPWVIADADIRLRQSGRVDVEVEGLVIGPNLVRPDLVGKNPVPLFKVTVSCLSTDAAGAATTTNVSSDSFPADAAGNAKARLMVDLPSPCLAPIIFVANGVPGLDGAWFALSGA